jgi:hypothetical protein
MTRPQILTRIILTGISIVNLSLTTQAAAAPLPMAQKTLPTLMGAVKIESVPLKT